MPVEHRVLRAQPRARAHAVRELEHRLTDNHGQLKTLVEESMPELLRVSGIGPVNAAEPLIAWPHSGRFISEAAFAMAAGTAPVQASSGRHQRHRLNRGGDRRLNCALYNIVINRSRTDPETRAYIERRRAQHKTDREIRRCPKRYLARRLFRLMSDHTNPLIHTA
jgi:transposase